MSEISEDMIHKAAVVISELRESEKGFIFSSRIAEAALEAAGVTEMAADRERIGMALFQNGYDSGWTTDSAVEAIEAMATRIAKLESTIQTLSAEAKEALDKLGY